MSPFKHWWNWSLGLGPSVLSKESSWIPTLYPRDFMLIFQGLKYLFLIQAALLAWFAHLWRVDCSSVLATWTSECPGWDPELGLTLGWGLCQLSHMLHLPQLPYSGFLFSLLLLRPSVKLLLYPANFQPLPSDVYICPFVQQLTAFPMSEHPIVVQILKSKFSFFRISWYINTVQLFLLLLNFINSFWKVLYNKKFLQ